MNPRTTKLGATRVGNRDWSFLVWAPEQPELAVRIYQPVLRTVALEPMADGYHGGVVRGLDEAPTYRIALADGTLLADPASRWQPEGVHGPSRGFDPTDFDWTDAGFHATPVGDQVIYELHVGTFTAEGTFDAAIARLDDLAALGITAVEPMPVAQFPGRRNWGYDGVFPFAVQDSYGGPVAFQRFVDACHARGLAVVLDVVYNHLGPEGNVLGAFAPYFTETYRTPWGAAVNFSEAGSDEVRRFFTENALMWLRDFHVDGLRLDAVHGIVDPTASPFLRELTDDVRALAASLGVPKFLIAESADNNPLVVSPPAVGGLGFDAQWNDDVHHALHALLTGERQGYYADFGEPPQLVRAFNHGFVLRGDYSAFRGRRHGSTGFVPADRLVGFAQNHDQIGNRAGAERLTSLVEPDVARLAMALVLLAPFVPLLFMGEEYAETAPFPYFIDHGDPDLVEAVRRGRAEEFGRDADRFDPADEATYARARLDWSARQHPPGAARLALVRRLLTIRREHPALRGEVLESRAAAVDGVLSLLRRDTGDPLLLLFNLTGGRAEVTVDPAAPTWTKLADSAEAATGGDGAGLPDELKAEERLTLPAYGFAIYRGVAGGSAW
ncbi:MAG TPA: malto-oligosyltrehalose trehalohydrolase [Mycobacteriales bacterium]|nr:malto-oligosyltrehalose trehalohydrolase [Mycobacteriales bacterium]